LALGAGAPEPLENFLGFSLGTAALKYFFAISGYFILASFMRCKSRYDYIAARVFRIAPALAVASFILAFVVGPLFTVLPWQSNFAHPAPWLYVPLTTTIFVPHDDLPGILANNIYPGGQ